MATYIIGDVQGCFAELQALLNVINFHPQYDRLGFTGDLVNRGPDSLNTLRFIKSLANKPIVVLGNHDLHLLALASGKVEFKGDHTLEPILEADDKEELIAWLRQQLLCYYDSEHNIIISHAGIPPQWSLAQALDYAAEVELQLRSDQFADFLQQLYGDQPRQWSEELEGYPRWRYIVNAFTRMRFSDEVGRLDLHNKTKFTRDPELKPWFNWYRLPQRMLFGHWAALEGQCEHPLCEALDTGCAWGGGLTAYRVEDRRRFYMPAHQPRRM